MANNVLVWLSKRIDEGLRRWFSRQGQWCAEHPATVIGVAVVVVGLFAIGVIDLQVFVCVYVSVGSPPPFLLLCSNLSILFGQMKMEYVVAFGWTVW